MLKLMKGGPVPNTNEIRNTLDCKRCAEQCPPGQSMRAYQDIMVGLTAYGLQVWCNRHHCNVIHFDFRGQRLGVNATAARDIIWADSV